MPADGVFFRLVVEDALDHRAFLSQHELNLPWRPMLCSLCEWCGLSLFRTLKEAQNLALHGRGRLRGARVAKGTLNASLGVTEPKPNGPRSTHTTYWPFRDVEPWTFFTIVVSRNG